MKRLLIEHCQDCKHFFDGDIEEFCEHDDAYRSIDREDGNGTPDWCPLPDASQQDVEADRCTCSASDNYKCALNDNGVCMEKHR